MFSGADIFWSIIVPLVVTIAITILAWQPWRPRAIGALWVAPVAIALAFLVAFPRINGDSWTWPLTTPHETSAWLPWIAVLAMFAGLFSATLFQPRWIVAILIFVLSIIACSVFMKFKFVSGEWNAGVGAMSIVLFAIIATAFALTLEQAREESPLLSALIVGITTACSAMALMLTGSLTYGKFALIVGFATAGFLPALLWRRDVVLRGLPATFAVMIVPLLLGGHFLSKLSTTLLTLIFITPIFVVAGILLPRKMPRWKRIVLRLIIAVIPLTAAVIIAAAQFNAPGSDTQSDDSAYYN